jgi:hypothetical protein
MLRDALGGYGAGWAAPLTESGLQLELDLRQTLRRMITKNVFSRDRSIETPSCD